MPWQIFLFQLAVTLSCQSRFHSLPQAGPLGRQALQRGSPQVTPGVGSHSGLEQK